MNASVTTSVVGENLTLERRLWFTVLGLALMEEDEPMAYVYSDGGQMVIYLAQLPLNYFHKLSTEKLRDIGGVLYRLAA